MSWDGVSQSAFARGRDRFPDGAVEPVAERAPRGPRIGLALGGGSARGWSHIGVIEALEEAGIHPEVVAGCSIGAVVGGCYAAGKLPVLKDFALSLTRRGVMGLIDVRFGSGLIAGDRLRRRLQRDLGERRIEQLPVRFASVATELGSGEEVWLRRGSLVEAMRASYALPGIFPPVRLEARLLMDGTLVNPVPVTVARALGADLVICVNLNGEACPEPVAVDPPATLVSEAGDTVALHRGWAILRGMRGAGRRIAGRRRRPAREPGAPGMARVMLDAFNITQDRISRARLASDPPDIAVQPRIGGMGLFEFHRAEEAIALGREAARAALPQIRAMMVCAASRV